MTTLAANLSRDCMDDDGFWKQIRKWIQKRFPGWSFYMSVGQRLVSASIRNWLRDLPKRIKGHMTDLEIRRQLIIEAMGYGYSFDYRWYRFREALGLLADDE